MLMLGVQFRDYHTAKDGKIHFASVQIDEPQVQTFQLVVPGRDCFCALPCGE